MSARSRGVGAFRGTMSQGRGGALRCCFAIADLTPARESE